MTDTTVVPSQARIVIIGGGIIGCSIAYHLTAMGETDVVLLEQHQLTDGATWHAAGLVGQLRSSRNTTRMLEHSVELYGRLEAETGQAVDWHQVGSLRLACSPERVMELKRLTTMAKSFGLPMEIISAAASPGAVPADDDRWRARRGLPSDRWIHRSGQRHPGDRQGRAHAQRTDLRAHQGHVDHRRRTAGIHCSHGSGRHRLRDGGQCCGHVGHGDRADGGRAHPRSRRRAPVRADRPDPRLHACRAAPDADDARPRSARVLQARRAGAADRRVRARHGAVRSRRHSRRRSNGNCWIRTSIASNNWPRSPHNARR